MMITGERRTIVKTAFTLMVFIAFSWGAADVQVRVRGCRKHYSGSGIHHADHLPTNIDRGQQTACRHYSCRLSTPKAAVREQKRKMQ